MKTNRNVFGLYRCGEKMYRKGSATARDCPACRPHRNRRTPRTPLKIGLDNIWIDKDGRGVRETVTTGKAGKFRRCMVQVANHGKRSFPQKFLRRFYKNGSPCAEGIRRTA